MTAVFNFLMIAGAVQGLIFNVGTFLSRKKIERPVLFLNLFVFFLSLNNLQSWIIDKGFLANGSFWDQFTIPWYVLIVPMFYAFLIYYLELEKKRLPFVLISLAIFIVELLARLAVTNAVRSGSLEPATLETYSIIEDIVTLAYSLFLFFKAARIVYRYEELYRPILAFDDLKWIKRFMLLGGVVFLLWLLAIVFNLSEVVKAPYSYYPLRLSSSILIYWVGYQAFFRYVVLKDRIRLRKAIRKGNGTSRMTYDKETLEAKEIERGAAVFNEIDNLVVNDQLFLDPTLSLESLSTSLGMGTSSLSKIMNANAGSNFPEYINRHRVEEAKKLLADDSFSPYTIVAIGLECGFNSKSTFYSAFKKFTGQTPTEYRKKHIS